MIENDFSKSSRGFSHRLHPRQKVAPTISTNAGKKKLTPISIAARLQLADIAEKNVTRGTRKSIMRHRPSKKAKTNDESLYSLMDCVSSQNTSAGKSPLESMRDEGFIIHDVGDDLPAYPVTSDFMADVTMAKFTSLVRGPT